MGKCSLAGPTSGSCPWMGCTHSHSPRVDGLAFGTFGTGLCHFVLFPLSCDLCLLFYGKCSVTRGGSLEVQAVYRVFRTVLDVWLMIYERTLVVAYSSVALNHSSDVYEQGRIKSSRELIGNKARSEQRLVRLHLTLSLRFRGFVLDGMFGNTCTCARPESNILSGRK